MREIVHALRREKEEMRGYATLRRGGTPQLNGTPRRGDTPQHESTLRRGDTSRRKASARTAAPHFLLLLLLFVATAAAAPAVSAITAEEIVRKMEENQVHESARSEGRMIINDRFGEKVITFVSWSKGEEKTLLEFTSRQERGQKILRTDNELYLYFPDAAEVIRLQGAALRDSVLGSDFSYEDMTGEGDTLEDYRVELLGTEEVDGEECYKLKMDAKSRNVPYPSQIVWVDTELFVFRKVHKFSLSGKLLKEMFATEFLRQSGKVIPVRMIMKDTMKRNSSTEFRIEELDLEADVPESTFSLEELTW
jgi:outer membrane lipoprotein-sorting protein